METKFERDLAETIDRFINNRMGYGKNFPATPRDQEKLDQAVTMICDAYHLKRDKGAFVLNLVSDYGYRSDVDGVFSSVEKANQYVISKGCEPFDEVNEVYTTQIDEESYYELEKFNID